MADPVSICQSILSLVVKVRGMLGKFHTNPKECNGILTHVGITEAVLKPLQGQPDIVEEEGMSAALAGLNKALQDASDVVRECQKKSSARRFVEVDAISKELLEVEKETLKYVNVMTLATAVDIRLILTDIAEKLAAELRTSSAHPDYQQVQKSVQTRRSSTEYPSHQIEPEMGTKKTDVAGRSEEKNEKENALAVDIKAQHASLSLDAKSTSGKRVDGQDHPTIVTKMISSATRNMTGVISFDVHPAEPWIMTGDTDGKVCIWNYEKQEPVMEKLVAKARTSVKEKDSKYYICSTKFITKMNWLVVGDGRGYIHVYDYTNSKLSEVSELKAYNDSSVDLLAVHPTKTCLLSLSAYGKKIILCDWSGGDLKKDNKEFDITPACPDCVANLQFHPRHSNIFACVIDKKLMVGNIKCSSLILKGKGLSVADYFFNWNDQPLMVILSTGSRDAEIRNLETGEVITYLHRDQRTVLVAGHPTLPILVTALDDGTVCFWDANTYSLQKTVEHVTDEPALDLTFVTDAKDITRLAVISESTIAIMEVSYSQMAITSGPTDG